MKIGQPFLTIRDYVGCMYVYIHNTKESLALNLEIGKTNWHSTVVANNGDSALIFLVRQMADPAQFWSAIFMFCLENGRWQAAISSSVCVYLVECIPLRGQYTHIVSHTTRATHRTLLFVSTQETDLHVPLRFVQWEPPSIGTLGHSICSV